MPNPSDLFRRAEKNGKKRCVSKPQSPAMFRQDRMPVPQPLPAAPAPQPPSVAPAQDPPYMPPRYVPGSHANYTALMRSHDRVHTRHIPKS